MARATSLTITTFANAPTVKGSWPMYANPLAIVRACSPDRRKAALMRLVVQGRLPLLTAIMYYNEIVG
jgi:hypothetical protein